MPFPIHLDTEQAALVILGIDVMQGALSARMPRADPDQIISKSYKLQSLKLEQLREALAEREAAEWRDLTPELRDTLQKLGAELAGSGTGRRAETIWRALVATVITNASKRTDLKAIG